MKIANAELKVVRFGAEDVIATSYFFLSTSDGLKGFYGEMTDYDSDASGWHIYQQSTLDSGVEGDQANIQGGGGYAYLQPNTYDAYEVTEGSRPGYYTKGASYYDLYGNQ